MKNTVSRRRVLSIVTAGASVAVLPFGLVATESNDESEARSFAVSKTNQQWRAIVGNDRYAVLFEEATERPGSSPLNNEKRAGTFICAACNQPLFKSDTKYDSGTGWPSFFDAIPGALGKKKDYKLVWPRTEYHCSRCGGHQGHVFTDGPQPTGLRYCNNGLALNFVAADDVLPELRS